jgi:hypothetical protein
MCTAAAARLARVVKCCVSSPGNHDDDDDVKRLSQPEPRCRQRLSAENGAGDESARVAAAGVAGGRDRGCATAAASTLDEDGELSTTTTKSSLAARMSRSDAAAAGLGAGWSPDADACAFFSSYCDADGGGGRTELVCCCERCDSLAPPGWFADRQGALRRGGVCGSARDDNMKDRGGGVGGTPLRVRNCLLACEADWTGDGRWSTVRRRSSTCCRNNNVSSTEAPALAPAADDESGSLMSCSLLAAGKRRLDDENFVCTTNYRVQRGIDSSSSHCMPSIPRWSPQSELTSCHQAPPNRTIGHLYMVAGLCDVDRRFCPACSKDIVVKEEVDDDDVTVKSTLCCLLTFRSSTRRESKEGDSKSGGGGDVTGRTVLSRNR